MMELTHRATDKLSLQQFLNLVVNQVARAVEIDHVKVLRYRAESADLLVEAGVGWNDGVVGHAIFSIDMASPPGRALQTGQPVTVHDITESEDYRLSPILRDHHIRSLLNVAIQLDGVVWGVMEVDSIRLRDFSDDTKHFLMTDSSIVAGFLRREQMLAEHQQSLAAAAVDGKIKETMLVELQHRVKNNFQAILSMIAIRKSRTELEVCKAALDQVSDSVIAMSLAHSQLSLTQSDELVSLPTYLKALALKIQAIHDLVAIEVSADDISVPVERAVSVGLIVNELVTNSVKHAFGAKGGVVKVELSTGLQTGELRLVISDNGRGLAEKRGGAEKRRGAGLKIVDALVQQIRGRMERRSSPSGLTTTITLAL
jgi:two-component sensor histidine kinase